MRRRASTGSSSTCTVQACHSGPLVYTRGARRWPLSPPVRPCALCREGLVDGRVSRRLPVGIERVLDAPGDRVDRLGVLADRVQRALLAPAGDIRHRLAADIEPDRAQHADRDRVDQYLAAVTTPFGVAEAMRMRNLVHQGADLAVGGPVGDDNLLALGVTPAAGAVLGGVADLDGVPELRSVGDQRGEQVAVAVAGDGL